MAHCDAFSAMNTCAGTLPVPPGMQGAARAVEPSPESPIEYEVVN
jgi:hypothetical protein